jgi:hypothetical protein
VIVADGNRGGCYQSRDLISIGLSRDKADVEHARADGGD